MRRSFVSRRGDSTASFNCSAPRRAVADLQWLIRESWRRRSRPSAPTSTGRAWSEPLESRRLLSAGDLDPTFGGNGRVVSDLEVRGGTAVDVAVQPDGKFVALISARPDDATSSNEDRFVVARYNADGTPDTGFSGDGRVEVVFDGNEINRPAALAIQPDGKIVAVGTTFIDFTGAEIAVARLNANGTFDNTFSDDGRRSIGFASSSNVSGQAVAVADGKIVVAGHIGNEMVVVRLNSNGLDDNTFSGDGKTNVDFSGSSDAAFAVAVDGSQRVIVAGSTTQSNGQSDLAIARLTSGGSLDGSFAGGLVETDFFAGVGSDEIATSLAIQGDGRIVAGGVGFPSGGDTQLILGRYNTNGTLDNNFDGDGRVETDPGGFIPTNKTDLLVLGDQRLVLGASAAAPNNSGASVDFLLFRYSTTGQPDLTFGTGGVGRASFYGDADELNGLAAVPGGGFIAAGGADFTFSAPVPGFARFDANGDLVTSFGRGGRTTDRLIGVYGGASQAARQGDKTIVLGATPRLETDREQLYVARFNANGSLDTTFGTDGYTFLEFGSTFFIGDLEVQADGRIVGLVRVDNLVEDGDDLGIFRLTADGQLDTGFASGGTFTTSFGRFENTGDLAITPDQKIVATGTVSALGGNDTTVVRLTSGGTLDGTFSGDGKLQIDLSGGNKDDAAPAVAVMPDGRIVLGGVAERDVPNQSLDDRDFMVARLTAAGALDPTFGNTQSPGVFKSDIGDPNESFSEIELLGDGRIILAGRSASTGVNRIVRLTAAGQYDTGFGGGNTAFPQVVQSIADLLIQPDGKIVIAGSRTEGNPPGPSDFAIERFLANGQVDTSFGDDGAVVTDFGAEFPAPAESHDGIANIFYTADDKLLAVGLSFRFWDERVAFARYLAEDGTDPTDPVTPFIGIESGVLVGRGTGGDDTITIRRTGGDDVIVQVNATSQKFDMDDFPAGVRLEGLGGNDRITVVDSLLSPVARRATLDGGAGDDSLTGNDGHDVLIGGDGNDSLVGAFGDDALDGGAGIDTVDGGPGDDTIQNAELQPAPGTIGIVNGVLIADGGWGQDLITIERIAGDNVIVRVNEVAREFDMDDFTGVLLRGNGGFDEMRVLDPVVAGSLVRTVTMLGGGGNDQLFGNNGPDVLNGGDGDDFLDARDGAGGDTVNGGNGFDTARVDPGDSTNTVESFV